MWLNSSSLKGESFSRIRILPLDQGKLDFTTLIAPKTLVYNKILVQLSESYVQFALSINKEGLQTPPHVHENGNHPILCVRNARVRD